MGPLDNALRGCSRRQCQSDEQRMRTLLVFVRRFGDLICGAEVALKVVTVGRAHATSGSARR
jgi:hypothetical protein